MFENAGCYLDVSASPGPSLVDAQSSDRTKKGPKCDSSLRTEKRLPGECEAGSPFGATILLSASSMLQVVESEFYQHFLNRIDERIEVIPASDVISPSLHELPLTINSVKKWIFLARRG